MTQKEKQASCQMIDLPKEFPPDGRAHPHSSIMRRMKPQTSD
jgi:hypothetical protein